MTSTVFYAGRDKVLKIENMLYRGAVHGLIHGGAAVFVEPPPPPLLVTKPEQILAFRSGLIDYYTAHGSGLGGIPVYKLLGSGFVITPAEIQAALATWSPENDPAQLGGDTLYRQPRHGGDHGPTSIPTAIAAMVEWLRERAQDGRPFTCFYADS